MNELLLLMAICFIGMLSPGPDFILVTRNALLYPRAQGFATALGIIGGCLVHATYCIFGLAFIMTRSILLFSTVKYIGAAYLLYLGFKGITARRSSPMGIKSASTTLPTIFDAFVQGFLCNVLNPKLALFLLSLFTQFIPVNASLTQKFVVALIFVGESALYWPILVIVLQLAFVRKMFSDFKVVIDRLSGAFLLYLGARVALSRGYPTSSSTEISWRLLSNRLPGAYTSSTVQTMYAVASSR